MVGVFHQCLDFPILPVNFLGYVAGGVNSYVLNRVWNFKSKNAYLAEIMRFAGVFILSYGINVVVLLFFQQLFKETWYLASPIGSWLKPGYAAHIIANVVYVIISFMLYKKVVFRINN